MSLDNVHSESTAMGACNSQQREPALCRRRQRSVAAQALTGSRVGAAAAAQHLDEMFGGSGGDGSRGSGAATTVAVVDEMDLLLNRNQHVWRRYPLPSGGRRANSGYCRCVLLVPSQPDEDIHNICKRTPYLMQVRCRL